MISNGKPSLVNGCVHDVFKFFFDDKNSKIYLSENISPEFIFFIDKLLNKEYTVIYLKSIEKCPVCGSELNKNGTDEFKLNKIRNIRKQKYVCKDKKCGEYAKAYLEDFIDKFCNYTRDIREFGLNIGSITHCSI